jgi:hypothetical protein
MAIVREDLTVDNNGHVVSLPQKLHDPGIDRASPAIRPPSAFSGISLST